MNNHIPAETGLEKNVWISETFNVVNLSDIFQYYIFINSETFSEKSIFFYFPFSKQPIRFLKIYRIKDGSPNPEMVYFLLIFTEIRYFYICLQI